MERSTFEDGGASDDDCMWRDGCVKGYELRMVVRFPVGEGNWWMNDEQPPFGTSRYLRRSWLVGSHVDPQQTTEE